MGIVFGVCAAATNEPKRAGITAPTQVMGLLYDRSFVGTFVSFSLFNQRNIRSFS